MKLTIKVTSHQNNIIVEDLTEYLEEGIFDSSSLKKSEVKSLIILSDSKDNIVKSSFSNTITNSQDGKITINYIVLPTKKWIDEVYINRRGLYPNNVYYLDQDSIYKYVKNESIPKEVRLEELIVNDSPFNNISIARQDYVSIQNLYDCYIDLCQQIFQNRGFSKCQDRNTIDSSLIYKRDLIWMGINIIDYLVDKHTSENPTLDEADRIIDLLHSCNGVCPKNSNYVTTECGCSKR